MFKFPLTKFVCIYTGTDSYPHDNGIVRALNSNYKPNERVIGSARHTIFIGRLHPKTDEVLSQIWREFLLSENNYYRYSDFQEALERKFRRYGKMLSCRLVRDIVTGASKQYAFIEYESSADAREAVHAMDKYRIDDSEIIVDHEHERRLPGWKPRRLGGGFGGKKESGQLRFGCRARPFQKPYDPNRSMTDSDLKEIFRYRKNAK